MGRETKRDGGSSAGTINSTKDLTESKAFELLSGESETGSSSQGESVTLNSSSTPSTPTPSRTRKEMNPLAQPFSVVSPVPAVGPSRSVVLSSIASSNSVKHVCVSNFPTWKTREQLLPSSSGEPRNAMKPRFILHRKIVTLEIGKFEIACQNLPPYMATLYKDARESREGNYCYVVADGMRMIPLITKMIFPLTFNKLFERYIEDGIEYPMNTIFVMEQIGRGSMEPVQYVQVYVENVKNDNNEESVYAPTGVYQMMGCSRPGFCQVFTREDWNEFRSRTIDMVRSMRHKSG